MRARSHGLLAAALGMILATPARAAIEALTLRQTLVYADDAIVGTLVGREVFRVDHAVDGTMYFTTITGAGESLLTDESRTRKLTFYGGIDADGEGWMTSVTPSPRDTAVGRRIVAFYAQLDALGFGVAGNARIAAHDRLFGPRRGDLVRVRVPGAQQRRGHARHGALQRDRDRLRGAVSEPPTRPTPAFPSRTARERGFRSARMCNSEKPRACTLKHPRLQG